MRLIFFEDYVEQCEVYMTRFNFRCYFPNAGIRFLPNVILPAYLKTDHHQPEPLTVSMLIASAEAGLEYLELPRSLAVAIGRGIGFTSVEQFRKIILSIINVRFGGNLRG